jgi:hypothetical protein
MGEKFFNNRGVKMKIQNSCVNKALLVVTALTIFSTFFAY